MKRLFTSESVTEGHPDKICDQIADDVLDALLRDDPFSRSACEVTAESGAVHIMGEIATHTKADYIDIARKRIAMIGYTKPEYGFDADTCRITCSLHQQSPDIALGVDRSLEAKLIGSEDIGAGDQGMMFGFACDETEALMPLPIMLAHALTLRLSAVRKSGELAYLRPDGKSQVTVEYIDNKPARIDAVVVSAQHDPDVDMKTLESDIIERVIRHSITGGLIDGETRFYVNPTGRFVEGGPAADTGLTGRKIIADTYGGYARHGGGAFSGKDSTKVDRSGAYMARCIAKTIVASGAARKAEIQIGYAIGVSRPVSVMIDTFGTGLLPDDTICDWINDSFDLRPGAIINYLDLRSPQFARTSCYGHFGRDFSRWEKVDKDACDKLRAML